MSDVTLIRTNEYDIRGEFLWFGVILHSDVFVRWSKGVRQRYREHLQMTARSLSCPVYAYHSPSHDPLKRKFILDAGLVPHHRRLDGNGEWAEMFILRPLDLSKGSNDGFSL